MVLTECAGREIDVDAANRFSDRGVAGKQGHRRTEDRIAALGLGVEEETLKAAAEASLDGARKIAQDFDRASRSDQHDLNPAAGSFDDEL